MIGLCGNDLELRIQVFTSLNLKFCKKEDFVRKQAYAMFWVLYYEQRGPLFIGKCFGFGWIVLDEGAWYYPMDYVMFNNLNAKLQN